MLRIDGLWNLLEEYQQLELCPAEHAGGLV